MRDRMKSEELVIVAAASAAAGAKARQVGLTSGSPIFDAFAGLAVAVVGFLTNVDGLSDAVEGLGVGFFLDSVL